MLFNRWELLRLVIVEFIFQHTWNTRFSSMPRKPSKTFLTRLSIGINVFSFNVLSSARHTCTAHPIILILSNITISGWLHNYYCYYYYYMFLLVSLFFFGTKVAARALQLPLLLIVLGLLTYFLSLLLLPNSSPEIHGHMHGIVVSVNGQKSLLVWLKVIYFCVILS